MKYSSRLIKTLIGIVMAPITLVILALAFINIVDWDSHRGFVKDMIERFTDLQVDAIEGIRVGLLTSAEIGVDKIRIRQTNPYSGLQAFDSKQAYVKVKVFPLIFQDRLIIQDFVLDGARLTLASTPADPNAKAGQGGAGFALDSLPSIFIHSASISDSNLTYRGESSQRKANPFRLRIEHGVVSAPANDKPSMLSADGRMSDLAFEVLGAFGSFDAFRDKKAAYPARLQAKIADHTLDARGSLRLAAGESHFDIDLAGPGLARLKKALKINIGDIPAYTLSFALDKKADSLRFEGIRLGLGRSSAFGDAGLAFAGARPLLQADLQSPLLFAADFKGLFKTDRALKNPEDPPKAPGQYFSDKAIDASGLKTVDADIKVDVKHFEGEKAGTAIDGAHARVQLNDGRLVAKPLRFAVSGGTIGGDLLFDARKPDIQVKINLGARQIDLDQLLGPLSMQIPVLKLKPTQIAKGLMTGHMALSMHGSTPMAMSKTVNGPVELAVEDGQFNATIIELAGVDIAEAFGDFILKNPMKNLQCGLLSFEAREGVYGTKALLIATSDTNFIGEGKLDLPGNKVDFRLKAHPRDLSLGSLRSPIYVRGPLNEIKAGLEKKDLIIKGVAAVALGAVNPALALIPLIEPGLGKKGECRRYATALDRVVDKAKENVRPKDLDATQKSTQKAESKSVNR